MLVPQFTIRWLLGATVACAVASAVVVSALHGNRLAVGACVAGLTVAATFAIQAGAFCLLRILAALFHRPRRDPPPGRSDSNPFAGLLLAAIVLGAATSEAATTRRAGGHGLILNVETEPLDRPGYHAARVTITCPTPPVADRRLTLSFQGSCNYPRSVLDIERTVDIPAGTTAPLVVDVPLTTTGQSGTPQLEVFEDGKLLKGLKLTGIAATSMSGEWGLAFPSFLAMDDGTKPDLSRLAGAFEALDDYWTSVGQNVSNGTTPPPKWPEELWTAYTADHFPRQWIEYTSFDIAYLTREQLLALQQHEPQALAALTAWVAAGGNLWIAGAGKQWEHLGAIERALGWSESPIPTDSKKPPKEWRLPKDRIHENTLDVPYEVPQWMKFSNRNPGVTKQPLVDPKLSHPKFLSRSLSLGQVVALAPESLFPGTVDNWRWVFNAVGSDRWLWYLRHGHVPQKNNDDFWNLMVPGTESAPIIAFWLLITLFVLLIGPVNYLWLRRRRRLDLLVLTVPLGAILITTTFAGYAIWTEGFDARVQIRGLTWIDQRRGHAANWSWMSYYTGLPVSQGLRFPADVAALPLTPPSAVQSGFATAERNMVWDGDQWLRSGWLSARTPTQYLALRSRTTNLGLRPVEPAQGEVGTQFRNDLGVPLELVVVHDADGKWYTAQNVAVGAALQLSPTDRESALDLAGRRLARDTKAAPSARNRLARRYNVSYGSLFHDTTMASGRLEKTLRGFGYAEMTRGVYMSILMSTNSAEKDSRCVDFIPRRYLAIADHDPECVLGIDYAKEVPGLHVICGEW